MEFFDYMPLICESDRNTLIAGPVGSGKSVLLNSVIMYIHTIEGAGMYLIDPKGTELSQYEDSDHTVFYSDDASSAYEAISMAEAEMERRFKDMKARRLRHTDLPPRFIIIDELAQFNKRVDPDYDPCNPKLAKIATKGRASGVYIIACTQRLTNDVITPLIKVNCDCKIALRTATEQESRNVLGVKDAHYLPKNGYCIMSHPNFMDCVKAPVRYFSDEEIEAFVYPNGHRANRLQVSNTRPQKPKSFLQRLLGV